MQFVYPSLHHTCDDFLPPFVIITKTINYFHTFLTHSFHLKVPWDNPNHHGGLASISKFHGATPTTMVGLLLVMDANALGMFFYEHVSESKRKYFKTILFVLEKYCLTKNFNMSFFLFHNVNHVAMSM